MKQHGFTLIELTLTIVVLGVLAVTAAPRFTDFRTDALEARVYALDGAVHSATDLVHAMAEIKNRSDETTPEGEPGLLIEDDMEVRLVNGYPAATSDGIIKALNMNMVAYDPFGAAPEEADWYYYSMGSLGIMIAVEPSFMTACAVLYQPAPVDGAPFITPQVANCDEL